MRNLALIIMINYRILHQYLRKIDCFAVIGNAEILQN